MMRPRILVIGDSLSIPRTSSTYEDTWLFKLKQRHTSWDIINLCEGARTTNCLVLDRASTGASCLSLYCPDIVVFQLGIVDCSPRLFPAKSLLEKLLRRLPRILSRSVVNWIKKIRGRKREYADVLPEKFESNLKCYFESCAEVGIQRVVVIAIAYPDERMISKNPEVVSSIDEYNEIYRKLAEMYEFVQIIEPLGADIDKTGLYEDDGYHFKATAHTLVYACVESALREAGL